MQIHITEIIKKAEDYYKGAMAQGDYDESLEYLRNSLITFIKKIQTEKRLTISIREAVDHFIFEEKQKCFKHLCIIAGFKLEVERQNSNPNKEEFEMMVTIALIELKEFYVPEGYDAQVLTVEEFVQVIEKNNKKLRKIRLNIFLLNSWIYFPLSLPFILIKIIFIVAYVIKPVWKEAQKDKNVGENFNVFKVVENTEKRIPAIFNMDYFHHHIIIGILLWLLYFTWLFS